MTNSLVFNTNDTNYSLSIQLSLNGFSFCVFDASKQITFNYNQGSDGTPYTEQTLLKKVTSVLQNTSELQNSFSKVEVIYHNELFTLVPNTLFNNNEKNTYLNYSVKTLATDYITHEAIDNTEIITVFIPYVNINNFLVDQFGEFNYHHSSKILIEHVLKQQALSITSKVFAFITDNQLSLIVTKGNSLELYNSFNYSSNEDVLYYILFCMEQLNLSSNEITLELLTPIKSDLFNLLYTYIRSIIKSTSTSKDLLHRLVTQL